MANLDKLRERAQYPDCIFSAFPDGNKQFGESYHPRAGDAELTGVHFGTLGTNKVEDGAFYSAVNPNQVTSRAGFSSGAALDSNSFTAMTKFIVDSLPDVGTELRYAPISMRSVPGGACVSCGFYGASYSGNLVPLDFSISHVADGSVERNYPCAGVTVRFTPQEWHTVAFSFDSSTGRCNCYFDGKKVLDYGFAGTTFTLMTRSDTYAYAYFVYCHSSASSVSRMSMRAKYGLWFNRALSDEEILYLMKE